MKLAIAVIALALGLLLPRLVGARETRTWTIWALRHVAPALCYGTALGLFLAYAFGR